MIKSFSYFKRFREPLYLSVKNDHLSMYGKWNRQCFLISRHKNPDRNNALFFYMLRVNFFLYGGDSYTDCFSEWKTLEPKFSITSAATPIE